jgi:quercetin dioxygenase-like cupin family protein
MIDETGPRAILVGPGEGLDLSYLDNIQHMKVTGDDTGGAFSVAEFVMAPGYSTPRHLHRRFMECGYILSGTVHVWIDGSIRTAGSGSFLLVPPGVPHALRCGDEQVRLLGIAAPGGAEKYWLKLIELLRTRPELSLDDIDRLLGEEDDIEVIGEWSDVP